MEADEARTPVEPAVTVQAGVVAVCLLVQAWLVDYDSGAAAVPLTLFWLAVGALLVWLVHERRSNAARWVLAVWGLLGGGLSTGRGLLLVAAFAGQALVVLRHPISTHCRTG